MKLLGIRNIFRVHNDPVVRHGCRIFGDHVVRFGLDGRVGIDNFRGVTICITIVSSFSCSQCSGLSFRFLLELVDDCVWKWQIVRSSTCPE